MIALKLIGITVVLLGLGFAGIAIKIWAKKDGEFAGTCASQSPFLNKDGETCSYCGKDPNQCETKLEQASYPYTFPSQRSVILLFHQILFPQ